MDLATAQANLEQFKEISRASEMALESVSKGFEEHKAALEEQLAQKTARPSISRCSNVV